MNDAGREQLRQPDPSAQSKLGTFLGVYTPTILTILGVIMYLRFGWLVGELGLVKVLVIVILAKLITMVTTLAFSAVATNTKLGAGGAYFIISRSLGWELGGAIGIPLYLSQTLSVTLYAYGLAESLRIVWPSLPLLPVALVIVAAVGAMALAGAERALRAQVPMLGLVALSLTALALGVFLQENPRVLTLNTLDGTLPFWAGFAIFFPAVTGVMAGLGLSGDLKNPTRSLPLGSLLAVATGLVIYLVVPVLLALGASPDALREEPLVWARIAPLGPFLILPGLWAAIFSSAVGSILAAPRTLQALAQDGIAPSCLRKKDTSRRALLPGFFVSIAIATGGVFIGNLNAVAAVVTMFFLTVYGTTNLVAAFEALSGDPSWRPSIRIPWLIFLAGGAGCLLCMLLIDPLVGVLAFIAEFILWQLLSRRSREERWGDARRGLYENLIRWALIRLARRPLTARNWRPHVLVFVDDPMRELDLVRYGVWFSQGRGVVTVCRLVVGQLETHGRDLSAKRTEMQALLDAEKLVVFAETDIVDHLVDGIVSVTQANGMAGLSSNTLLLGWPSDRTLQTEFLRAARKLEQLEKSIVLGRIRPRHQFAREQRTIHVWWGGLQHNSELMLLLAYLLQNNPEWRGSNVKVLSIASSQVAKEQTDRHLARVLSSIRMEVEIEVLVKPRESSVAAFIGHQSEHAAVVFLGLASPKAGEEEGYAERIDTLAGKLPVVFFVRNASVFVGDLLETPEGEFAPEDTGTGE